ncbi:MAG: hypothetical protein J5I93_27460 [Pirellulaceae bacterium]|nr:hypothetical protein [Pirellulaceae bacterium]
MATRESQGLQIALIVFVLITVALAVTSYLYFRKSEEKIKEAVAARQAENQAKQTSTQAIFQVQALKAMVGWGEADLDNMPGMDQQMQEIIAAFKEDMQMYGEGLPDEDRNYRNLPRNMETAIRERNANLVEANVREQTLIVDKQNVEDREIKRADAAETAAKTDSDKYITERQEFVNYKQTMKADFDKMVADNEQVVDRYKTEQTKLTNEKSTLAKEVGTLTNLLSGARERLEQLRTTNFETPDGRVTWVNQGSRVVWINVGMADGLRPQTTFAVYDRDEAGVMKPERKGAIEVIRVLDQHLAEANILEDDLKNPILPGDVIHSPAWRPGRRVHFALAGFMDIDGDGESDRDLLRNLITMSGGVIDSEVHDDGQRTGALTNNTRYLIRGERPSETSGPAAIQGYSQMDRDAKNMSVETINLDEFLTYIGWKGEVRTVQLGSGARSDDFKATPAGGVNRQSTGATSEVFRSRQPPARGANGAFP